MSAAGGNGERDNRPGPMGILDELNECRIGVLGRALHEKENELLLAVLAPPRFLGWEVWPRKLRWSIDDG